jgi:hypothetical protein
MHEKGGMGEVKKGASQEKNQQHHTRTGIAGQHLYY